MKIKKNRYNFTLDDKTSELIKQLAEKTDLSYTRIIERSLEMFGREKGILNK